MKLVELGGSLCVNCMYFLDERPNHFNFWVMKESGVEESWTKLFSMVPSDVTGFFECVMPLAYLKTAHQDGDTYLPYDLETKRIENMGKVSSASRSFDTCVCVRSLIGFGVGENIRKKAKKN